MDDFAQLVLFEAIADFVAANCLLSDADLFHLTTQSFTSLDLSSNGFVDISLLYVHANTLLSLNISHNNICGIANTTDLSDLDEFTAIFKHLELVDTTEQDSNVCDSHSECLDVSMESNTVCREIWTGVWRAECVMFSFYDSHSESPCTLFDDLSTIPGCVSVIAEHSNKQCVQADDSTSEGCVVGWYGDNCDIFEDCPSSDGLVCGGNGVCINELCECYTGFSGDSCEIQNCSDSRCSSELSDGNGKCISNEYFSWDCQCSETEEVLFEDTIQFCVSKCGVNCPQNSSCVENNSIWECQCDFTSYLDNEGSCIYASGIGEGCYGCVSSHGFCDIGDDSLPFCHCYDSFYGERCEESYPIDSEGRVCGWGEFDLSTLQCNCDSSFFLNNDGICELPSNEYEGFCEGCMNGQCMLIQDISNFPNVTSNRVPTCVCDWGWGGNQCDIDSCGVKESELCHGHGLCVKVLEREFKSFAVTLRHQPEMSHS
ncbi:hypothetical protein ADUPG1_006398 [Aduncisulcus paluster]|uniref:EGF-like domain-containing protein n=1 Tax=Aduncisulcus paluster TaxID=2918883 RepID=A0ABQ5KI39_9EUKA|nr:hypothetical protein ADUPG1_006398 [Aduncisulcus paluster]